jgi:beta-glucanase (GH16 family)
MRKAIVIIVCACQSLAAQVLLKVYADSLQTFIYKEGDEFSGTKLDGQRWQNGIGWTRVIMENRMAFEPDNVIVKDGLIRFVADKKDSLYRLANYEIDSAFVKKNTLSNPLPEFLVNFSAGCIVSRKKQHYGVYELRFKVEEGKGTWPAFWFYGGDRNEELDVFELKGERTDEYHVDVHCPGECERGYKNRLGIKRNWNSWVKTKQNLFRGFNTATLEWTPNDITWLLNGVAVAYYKGNFANPMNLYLNTSVAHDNGPFSPGPDNSTSWPNTFYADYLRIYEKQTGNGPVTIPDLGFQNSDAFPSDHIETVRKRKAYMFNKAALGNFEGSIEVVRNKSALIIIPSGPITESGTRIEVRGLEKPYVFEDLKKNVVINEIPDGKIFELLITRDKKTLRQQFVF